MKKYISNSDMVIANPGLRSRAGAIVFAMVVSAGAIYAAANGPALWSRSQRLKSEQIRQEDLTFCEKFRMPPGSESFATCVSYLTEIRRLHGDRLAAEAAGAL